MISEGHRIQLERFFPYHQIDYDPLKDVISIKDPRTGMTQLICGEVLMTARSVTDILRYVKQRLDMGLGEKVSFWGKAITGRSFNLITLDDLVKKQTSIIKENTKMKAPEQDCPVCQAPEEQEVTLVERTFRVDVSIYCSTSRSFVVMAFDGVGALAYVTDILSDEVEFDGSEEQISGLNATLLEHTEMLI